jgi:shikimate kinase
MKRVLFTGMSGTGKSALIIELAARGYKAIDADSDEWSEWVPVDGDADPLATPADAGSVWQHQDWLWREDRIQCLLETEDAEMLFVSGTASNQGKFHARFDHIVLLSAPVNVLMERLSARTANHYGKDPKELARILQHLQTVEPLLRRAASLEIDTTPPVDQVVDTIVDLVGS